MKKSLFKTAIIGSFLIAGTQFAKAQQFGDNLGNHKATKDLQMQGKQILNASGIAIGTTTLVNGSVALQIDGADKAILIPRVTANASVVAPLNGMIVYNTTDNKFYLYQNGAWVTFALSMKVSTDGINTIGDANGYTLTTVGQETLLKLSPATLTEPGVVTTGDQSFGGNKTFGGNLIVSGTTSLQGNTQITGTSTLTVGTGKTTLGGDLSVAGKADLSGDVNAAKSTTLNADPTTGGITIKNPQLGTGSTSESFIVIDQNGLVKKSTLTSSALAKFLVAIPTGSSAGFSSEGNSAVKVVLHGIAGVKADDAIVVNFSSGDMASFDGLTILSALATGDGEVTVNIADFRNPAETPGYAKPALDGKNLVVTRYSPLPLN